jgi:hypothetical protein
MNNWDKVERVQTEIYRTWKEAKGDLSPDTLAAQYDLAIIQQKNGATLRATNLVEDCVNNSEQVLGKNQ